MTNINIRITIIINIIIFFSFLGHFGITIFGQDIYYFYIIEIFLLIYLVIKDGLKIDITSSESKLILLLLLLTLIGGIVSTTSDLPDFKGQSILTSSLKGSIYFTLNILMLLVIITYGRNEYFFSNLFQIMKYLILFYVFYFILEAYHDYYSKNYIIKETINFFHTSTRSINKGFINLLGHEHSNSSIYVLLLYSYMIANLLNQKRVFNFYLIDISIIAILVIALFLLESKLGYLIFFALNLAILLTVLFNTKLNIKYFISLIFLFLVVFLLIWFFGYKVEKAMRLILNYDHPSFNIRANFALAAIYLMYKFPILGVGINNFKFYVEDAIDTIHNYTWLNIKTEGDVDGYSTLELGTYLYTGKGFPDPANMIIGIGAEMGVVALLVFLLMLMLIFIKSFSQTKKLFLNKDEKITSHFLFYSLIIVIISFLGFYQLYFVIQWIILGLNICFYNYIFAKYNNT